MSTTAILSNDNRFTSFEYDGIKAVNLARNTACVFGDDDSVIETSMDDI